jgi:hypothetical protein
MGMPEAVAIAPAAKRQAFPSLLVFGSLIVRATTRAFDLVKASDELPFSSMNPLRR